MTLTATGAELASVAAAIPPDHAADLAREMYGLDGTVEWLWGEKDSNYRLTLGDGRVFLLKILTPTEDAGVTDMHSRALAHMEARDPGVPVQRVIRTRDGALDTRMQDAEGSRAVRVVTFLPGVTQQSGAVTPAQGRAVGSMLRRMQTALSDFDHPSARHPLTWDTTHVAGLARHIPLLPAAWQADVAAAINRFTAEVTPHIAALPAQVIHNDFNRENILVDPVDRDRVTGIIDFGDLCHATRLIDVAVACCYQQTAEDPVGSVQAVLEGFGPLTGLEHRLLWTAIRARSTLRLLIPYWRASLMPDQAERFLKKCPAAWEQFQASGRTETLP